MVSIRDEEFSSPCQEGERGDCVILNTLDSASFSTINSFFLFVSFFVCFLQYHSLLTTLHSFHSRFTMLPIKRKEFPTVLPGAVYFLWESIAVKKLGQTQKLVVDSHLTALGIKESN